MASLAGFFDAPLVTFIKARKKDDLLCIADHFGVTVAENCVKMSFKMWFCHLYLIKVCYREVRRGCVRPSRA